MIISHICKSCFIHVPKTGGRSISEVLDKLWPDAEGKRIRIPTQEYNNIVTITQKNPQLVFNRIHIPAVEQKAKTRNWDEYKTFAFVRNPWDRMVSLYCHFGKGYFKDFVFNSPEIYVKPQLHYITENGKIIVKHIGRFETLKQDFENLNPSFIPYNFPHYNKSNHLHYREYYDKETIACVRDHFEADINTFGYSY